MDIRDLNLKFKKFKQSAKNWCYDHKDELIVLGTATVTGVAITGVCVLIENSKPVTVNDVTDTLNISLPKAPEPWDGSTMYDDRLNVWIPVRRALTDDEIQEVFTLMEENQDYTLLNYLNEHEIVHPYANDFN